MNNPRHFTKTTFTFTCSECQKILTPKGISAICLCKVCKLYFCIEEGYILNNDKKVVDIIRGAAEGIITDFQCYQCEAKANLGRDRNQRKDNTKLRAELVKEQDEKLANVEQEAKEKIEGEREAKKKQVEAIAKSAEERAKAKEEQSEKIKKMMEKEKEEIIEGGGKIKAKIDQERKEQIKASIKTYQNEQKAKEEGEKAELARKETEKKQLEEIAKSEKEKEQARILKKNQDHSNYLIIPNKEGVKGGLPVMGYNGKIEVCNGYLDFWKDNEAMATDIFMSFYYEVSKTEHSNKDNIDYYYTQSKGDIKNYCLECSKKIWDRWGIVINNSAMIEAMKTQEEIKRLLKPSKIQQ